MLIPSRHFRAVARQTLSLAARVHSHSPETKIIPSIEQKEVIKLLKTHNVVVSARPGAGKTATIEALVQENPAVPVAVITYSKRLHIDTSRRLRKYSRPGTDPRIQTFTFHGLAGKLFGRTFKDDSELINEREKASVANLCWLPQFRFIVLDEIQDLTDDLYWVASVLIASITRKFGDENAPKILALGDARQAIYEFRGADTRFIEKAPEIFHSVSKYGWKSLSLAQSFRLSQPTTHFVNNVFLGGQEYIIGTGGGVKPSYILANLKRRSKADNSAQDDRLRSVIFDKIKQYGAENCAILSPSVRNAANSGYLARLANFLSRAQPRTPVSVSIYDDAPLLERVTRGKLIISTYHQFKGVERDLIIVFGADAAWFDFHGRELPRDSCPNPIFVALTRARKELIVIHARGANPLPFMDTSALSIYANLVVLDGQESPVQVPPKRAAQVGRPLPESISVTDLVRHVPDKELHSLIHQREIVTKHSPLEGSEIHVLDEIRTGPGLYETVADLTGTAVTRALQSRFTNGPYIPGAVPEDSRQRAIWRWGRRVRRVSIHGTWKWKGVRGVSNG